MIKIERLAQWDRLEDLEAAIAELRLQIQITESQRDFARECLADFIAVVRAWRDRKRNRALPGHEDVSIIQLEDAIWKALDELERVNTDTESPQEALSNQS